MNYRIWFSIIATYLLGCWVGSFEPLTEADEDLVSIGAIMVIYAIYLFASHRNQSDA